MRIPIKLIPDINMCGMNRNDLIYHLVIESVHCESSIESVRPKILFFESVRHEFVHSIFIQAYSIIEVVVHDGGRDITLLMYPC